jgi:hypothetical protein
MPTKAELIAVHEKTVKDCEKLLASPRLKEFHRPALTKNLKMAKTWIEHLSNPETPELGW